MIKNICNCAILLGVLSSSLFAALPPLSQSAKEIDAIMQHSELASKLDQANPIRMIRQGRDNSYIVLTTKQRMRVDVIYDTQNQNQMAGPQKFTLIFHDPMPIGEGEVFNQ